MASGFCGDSLMWWLDGDTLTISGKGEMNNYSGGRSRKKETSPPWYDIRANVKKIIVNYGVTTIGDSTFRDFNNLTEVILPNSLTKIGEAAFYYCWNLGGVDIPDNVKTIEICAFGGCHGFSWVTIPESVVYIGAGAFSACEGLTNVKIPASVMKIGKGIFSACFLKKIHYPAGRGFEENLSYGNKAQLIPYTVTPPAQLIPYTVETPAKERKFFPVVEPAPEKLRWKVEGKTLIVGGVREIKFYRYGDLPWVRSVDAIQEIVIAEGVEKISANAFSECTRLELLTIPASVKTIGDYAFTFCYCGNRAVNGGKNVIWSLDDGVLTFKKNPAAKFATDFSIGVVSWRAVEKNITGFKLEAGVVPKEKFFEWLAQRDNVAQISFA